MLQHGAQREQNAIPDDLMPLAQRVSERIWKTALEDSPPENTLHKDWLSTAINRPGGDLAKFWLSRVSAERRQAGESWKGIPQAIADSLRLVIRGSSGAAVHARVVLASQLHYFFSLDAPFAQAELLPLFGWKADSAKAEQCWHGFLIWGRWLQGFTEQLLPQFNETVNRAAQLPEDIRQGLVNHIAGLALFRIDNPLADGWFMAIVKNLAEPDLERLAWTIDRSLDQTATETAEHVWTRWLKEYWKLRLLGTPRPLIGKEANETACWALSVGCYFPEAVRLVSEMGNAVSFEHTPLIYRIERERVGQKSSGAHCGLGVALPP